GANIVINYRNSDKEAEELKAILEEKGVKVLTVKCDISNFEDSKNLMDKCKEVFRKIDILVNNAGITKDTLIMRMKEEDFDNVIDVNLKGTFNCAKHASAIMLKQRFGKIINMTSVVGIAGNAGQVNYAASKAGVIGLTKSLAKELGSRGITVNAVAPGFINTDMTASLSEKVKEEASKNIPLKRLGDPEDVANLVGFLASDAANYITGQVINVDGGMVM
ncbi:3-oxoacyl-[acyl-carrier-protein] reductase, partial [Clostridium perfringens]